MQKELFIATIEMNGETKRGPVSAGPDGSYVFVNKFDSLDMWFGLTDGTNGEWYQSGGPISFRYPDYVINAVGKQIDDYIRTSQI